MQQKFCTELLHEFSKYNGSVLLSYPARISITFRFPFFYSRTHLHFILYYQILFWYLDFRVYHFCFLIKVPKYSLGIYSSLYVRSRSPWLNQKLGLWRKPTIPSTTSAASLLCLAVIFPSFWIESVLRYSQISALILYAWVGAQVFFHIFMPVSSSCIHCRPLVCSM